MSGCIYCLLKARTFSRFNVTLTVDEGTLDTTAYLLSEVSQMAMALTPTEI